MALIWLGFALIWFRAHFLDCSPSASFSRSFARFCEKERLKPSLSDEEGEVDQARKKIEGKLSETCRQTLQDVDKLVQHKQPDYSKALKILDEVGQYPHSPKDKAQIEEKARQIKAKWVDDLSNDFKGAIPKNGTN